MRRGWVIPAWPIVAAGLAAAVVLALMPPVGSSDPLNDAAYGRMVVTGNDPYVIGADVLADSGIPWLAPSRTGAAPRPSTGRRDRQQTLASLIGGTSTRLTVFAMSVINLAAFAGTGLLLHRRRAATGAARCARSCCGRATRC